MPTVVSDPARQLQRQTADRIFVRSEKAHARAKGDSDLGWTACAQEPEDETVSGEPARLAANRNAAGLFSRPDPAEDLWGNIKGQELANRCVAGLGEAEASVRSGMERVRLSKLPFSFLHHAGLFF